MSSHDYGLKKIYNPPFKSYIDYRIGDYNTFRKIMFSLIKKNALLGGSSVLKSDRKDYGAALADMWAYLCDILTYYQERIATESFLRTAGLEESVIELLYLVDYLPRRGRSASTLVRFVANEKNIAPRESTIIPKGFKIRSIPAKGKESIIFETDEPIVVSSDHNIMKLEGWRTSYRIRQGTTELVLDKIYPELNIGDLVMISDEKNTDVIRIIKKADKDGKSQITWAEDKGLKSDYNLSNTRIQKFTQVVRPFGYNAPPSILSNVGVILYKKNPNAGRSSGGDSNGDNNNNSTNTGESRERVPGRLVQIVDVSDRVIASAVSDKDGKFTFRALIPGSYRILIARSKLLTDESQLHPVTTISSNRFQLLPGFESWFDAELEFGGTEIQTLAQRWKDFLSKLAQENPFAEEGFSNIINSILPADLQDRANDILPDLRPTLNLKPQEPYPFDPVNDDILGSQIYLDKVYGNVRQGSFVLLSKDDPSNQIDISRQLFKVSQTGQMFHAKYGIGGVSSTINLQGINGPEEVDEDLIFCWDDILQELKEVEKGPEEKGEEKVPGKEIKKLIDFLNQDIQSLDNKTDTLREIENGTAIQISDQNKKNIYLIKLNEKDEERATLFKNEKRLLEFIVRREGGDGEKKTNLYAKKIESGFYKIRNTLIFTNPVLSLGVDPRDASQDKTDEHADSITLEGMRTGLKAGVFLAINDNTSIIQGRLVDGNLKALQGYRVAVYRIQKQEDAPSSFSTAATPIEVTSESTNPEGSFIFDDLRADGYLISVSLPLDRYWSIFVESILGKEGNSDDADENEKKEIMSALLLAHQKKIAKDLDHRLKDVAEVHLKAFLNLIEVIRAKANQNKSSNFESRFTSYPSDIIAIVSEIETIIKETILSPLLEAGSIETTRASSSSSSSTLLNKSSTDTISSIEQKLEPKLSELESKAQQVLNRVPNDRLSASTSFLREFAEKTIIMRLLPILKEIVVIIKEILQDPFRSRIYEMSERLIGVTKILNVRPNTSTNITMTYDINKGLTYVDSLLEYSKLQVTKVSASPTFSEGKTQLNLDPALKYRYVKGFAEIYGNIAPASHGETVKDEILGSGDASAIHQVFTLRKGPLSYVPSPLSPDGIKSTLKVIVNDVQWEETEDFLKSSPNDQHYVTSLNEDGSIKITFGDGIRGSTLPTGVDNIHAQYRIGIGFRGNLEPDTPVVPQENNPAIKSISIPAGSYGGAEKIFSQLKQSYRSHILTLGRAISLEDYSNLATTFGEIAKARAYLMYKAGREIIVLVVAGHRGRTVSSPLQMELRAYMDERRDNSLPLEIESFVPVPVDIVVEVKINDSYRRSKVVSNIQTRLGSGTRYENSLNNDSYDGGNAHDVSNNSHRNSNSGSLTEGKGDQAFSRHYNNLFSFDRLNFGQKVTLNEVYAVVENVAGVDFALVRKFCRRDTAPAASITPLQEIINANHNEILQCENDPLDPIRGTIKIMARGGIEL